MDDFLYWVTEDAEIDHANMTTEHLEEMFDWVDFNDDGYINYGEYLCMMRGRASGKREEMIDEMYPGGRGFFGGRKDFDLESLNSTYER